MTVHLSTYLHLDFIYKFGRGPDGINTDGVESRGKGRGLLYKGGGGGIIYLAKHGYVKYLLSVQFSFLLGTFTKINLVCLL